MDGDTAHRLGLAARHLQRYDWAEGALGVAYQLSPGHASVLEGLEHIAVFAATMLCIVIGLKPG